MAGRAGSPAPAVLPPRRLNGELATIAAAAALAAAASEALPGSLSEFRLALGMLSSDWETRGREEKRCLDELLLGWGDEGSVTGSGGPLLLGEIAPEVRGRIVLCVGRFGAGRERVSTPDLHA